MTQGTQTVGVIGLGNMGGGMARTLARAGYRVLGVDPSERARAHAAEAGVVPVADVGELAREADVVITVLPDSPEVEACLLGPGGMLENARAGMLVIECSTIEPAVTDRAFAALSAAGVGCVDAALGRSPAEAESGTLLFMVGGSEADCDRAAPLLDTLGDTVHRCGPAGSGIRTKLVLNLLSQSTCQLSAEAVALGIKMGLDRDTLLAVMGAGLGANGFITRYWPTKVLVGDTDPGFAIALSAKDLRHAMAMAQEAEVPVPTGAAAAAAINAAARTDGDRDVSGLLTVACRNAGVVP